MWEDYISFTLTTVLWAIMLHILTAFLPTLQPNHLYKVRPEPLTNSRAVVLMQTGDNGIRDDS